MGVSRIFNRGASTKIKQSPSGAQISEMLARGEVDLGFQQVTELMHVKGNDYLGPLPADLDRAQAAIEAIRATAQHRLAITPFSFRKAATTDVDSQRRTLYAEPSP